MHFDDLALPVLDLVTNDLDCVGSAPDGASVDHLDHVILVDAQLSCDRALLDRPDQQLH